MLLIHIVKRVCVSPPKPKGSLAMDSLLFAEVAKHWLWIQQQSVLWPHTVCASSVYSCQQEYTDSCQQEMLATAKVPCGCSLGHSGFFKTCQHLAVSGSHKYKICMVYAMTKMYLKCTKFSSILLSSNKDSKETKSLKKHRCSFIFIAEQKLFYRNPLFWLLNITLVDIKLVSAKKK